MEPIRAAEDALAEEPGPGALRPIWADLHLHTVVSACAEVEMIPPLIMEQAQSLGLGIIAVTDHHTADNVAAMQRAGREHGIAVLPGMEVASREGADIVCLFDTLEQVLAWQDAVYAHLPEQKNRPEFFGAQYVVDETGEFMRENERLLATSTSFAVEELVRRVLALGGLAIAAHVDRPSGSLLGNLGFVPPDLPLAALELSVRTSPAVFLAQHPELAAWPIIVSGDAHRLNEMRASTFFTVAAATVPELALAFGARDGRKFRAFA